MPASPGERPSITVHGGSSASRSSGRIRKPTAKVRVVQSTSDRKDYAEIKNEIKELSSLLQEVLRRDAEREQLLKNYSEKVEALEKELQEERQRVADIQAGLARPEHAPSTGRGESGHSPQGLPPRAAQAQSSPVRTYADVARQPPTGSLDRPAPARQAPLKDLRVFARLSPDSKLRSKRAYDLYAFLRKKLPP